MGCGSQNQYDGDAQMAEEPKQAPYVPPKEAKPVRQEQAPKQQIPTKVAPEKSPAVAHTPEAHVAPVQQHQFSHPQPKQEKLITVIPSASPSKTPVSRLPNDNFYFKTKKLQMFGGYFVQPKRAEPLQTTQLLIAAPTGNQVTIRLKAKGGKCQLIALRPGPAFPLALISDILGQTQVEDVAAELTVDCPSPRGFVVYVMTEGKKAEVEIDGLGKMLLELQHGDINAQPPKLMTIAERRAARMNKDVTIKEKTYISHYSVNMHGGFIVPNTVGEEIDDNQIQVIATEGNKITVTASVDQGKVGLMALRATKKFPLVETNDILSYAEPSDGRCEMNVISPGVDGFIIYLMANAQLCDVNIDGNGRLMLAVGHDNDHVPTRAESSISHSSKSSILKRTEIRGDVKRLTWIKDFKKTIQGGCEIEAEAGIDIGERHQVLVYAPTDNKIVVKAKSSGAKCQILAFKRDTFPLERTTELISASEPGAGEASLTVDSPGPRGLIFYFIGGKSMDVSIDGGDKMLLEVCHSTAM